MLQACYYKIIIAILLVPVLAISQNLVPNGNFETYSTCPTASGQINHTSFWKAATGTPDYYNACDGFGNVSVPRNIVGYQLDCCGGGGYMGIYTLYQNTSNNDQREYIYTKLIDTLKAGHKYLASMYVNKTDGFDYAIATIGMLFTDTATALPWPQGYIPAIPQVKHTTLIADTSHWTLIQDTIIAIGNESYLTIGNFNTSATCDSVNVGGNGTFFGEAYYLIDGVSVYDLATMGIDEVKNIDLQLNIYPNPSNGNMAVEYKITEDAAMQIIDLSGNLVETYSLPASGSRIEVKNQNLQNGVYLYRINSNNVLIKFGKVIILK